MRASTATHNTNDWKEMKNDVEQKLCLIKTAFDLVRLKWSNFKCVKVQKKSNSKNKLSLLMCCCDFKVITHSLFTPSQRGSEAGNHNKQQTDTAAIPRLIIEFWWIFLIWQDGTK